jgi:uncharacterized protein YecT (DUF1311 family)
MRYVLAAAVLAMPLAFAAPAVADESDGIDCNHAVAQLDMNICADKDYRKADGALNATYAATMKGLDKPTADKLRAAQREWIKFRDAECVYLNAKNEGGSIYPMVYSGCLTRLTKIRTQQLRQGNTE